MHDEKESCIFMTDSTQWGTGGHNNEWHKQMFSSQRDPSVQEGWRLEGSSGHVQQQQPEEEEGTQSPLLGLPPLL